MNIVFNINNLGLEGLAATLVSLLKNFSSPSELNIWFLCNNLSLINKKNIEKLLHEEGFRGTIYFKDFDAKKIFGNLHGLHGDFTPYGRILIPEIVGGENNILYLDADLIIQEDLACLFEIKFDEPIAAVGRTTFEFVLEKEYFLNVLKVDSTKLFFNSGVLLINPISWKKNNIQEKISLIGDSYGRFFKSADQTLLNSVFCGNFYKLPIKYNTPWYPDQKEVIEENSIIHFVGSPKPWDFMGIFSHKGYQIYKKYTPMWWENSYNKWGISKIKRTYNIRKSILKRILK